MAKEKDSRCHNWSTVLYPESAKENWREILDEMHLKWVESPLHDKDINPDGEPKKAHIHIGLFFAGKKSYEQILEICEKIGAVVPQRIQNSKGFVHTIFYQQKINLYEYALFLVHRPD